jgi:energy-converting hydrogenase Eha subunit H
MFNLINSNYLFLSATFCLIIVILGTFFLFNLILAVIIGAFIRLKNEQQHVELNKLDELIKKRKIKKRMQIKMK